MGGDRDQRCLHAVVPQQEAGRLQQRHVAGAASGWAADRLGFGTFALYTVLLSVPAFLLLPWVRRRVAAVET